MRYAGNGGVLTAALTTRRLVLIALVGLLATAGAWVFHGEPFATSPTTLSLAVPQAYQAHYRGLADAFAASNPGMTVEVSGHPAEGSHIPPSGLDVIVDYGGYLSTQRAHLRDLAPHLDAEPSLPKHDFYPPTLDLFTLDGQLRILPFTIEPFAMLYNKDLFDRYGVPYPRPGWDWAAFLETAKALTHPEDGVWGYGAAMNNGMETFNDALQLVAQNGGRVFDDVAGARATFTNPATVEAIQWYVDLIRLHRVAPLPQEVPHNREGFFEGHVAMVVDGPLRVGTFPQLRSMSVGIVGLPRGRSSAVGDSAILGIGIPAGSVHPEQAWKLIVALEQQMPPRSQMPVRRSMAENAAYQVSVGPEVAALTRAAANETPLFLFLREVTQPARARALSFFRQAVGKALAGEMSVQDAMAWAQRQADGGA
jgi:ABC-type glycerol-3-phosphate transport system substrate-binding protein